LTFQHHRRSKILDEDNKVEDIDVVRQVTKPRVATSTMKEVNNHPSFACNIVIVNVKDLCFIYIASKCFGAN
jgi:hypothetical protein